MGPFGGNDDDDEQQDGLMNALVYGNRTPGQGEQPAPTPAALPGAQPSQGNYSTKDSGAPSIPSSTTSHPMQSNEDDFLKPASYNPPQRPASLDQAQGRVNADADQVWKYGTATDRNAPNVKPRWYDRALGGVAAALTLPGGPTAAINAYQGVTDRRFNQAESARMANLDAARKQYGLDNTGYENQDRDYENQLQRYNQGYNYQGLAQDRAATANDRRAQEQQRLQGIAPGSEAPDDPQNPMAGWHGTTIGGKQIKMAQPPDSWLKTPQGVAAQRDADVQRLGLKGDDAKFYRANGKLKEPAAQIHIHNPSADEQEWNTYLKTLGHPPTTEDVINFKRGNGRGGSGGGGKMSDAEQRIILQHKDDALAKAQQRYKTAASMAQSDAEKQEAQDDFLDDAETAQRAFEHQIDQKNGGSPVEPFDIRSALKSSLSGGAQPQSAPQSAPAPQSQPALAPQQQAPPPTHARFNAGKWKAANPKGDVNAAIQAAKAKGYEIVGQ